MFRVIIDQIEAHPADGSVTVRFLKQHVDEAGVVTDLGYHRSSVIEAGDDVQEHIAAINDHLARGVEAPRGRGVLKFPSVSGGEIAEIAAIAALLHTPERVAARRGRDEERRRRS